MGFQDEELSGSETRALDELPRMRGSYVLCEKLKNQKSPGGIHIPESAGNPFVVVRAAGPGSYQHGVFVPCDVKPGDRVLIDQTESDIGVLRWGGVTYCVISECYLKAVLPEKEPEQSRIVAPVLELVKH